jgi:hypothetical protein
MHDCFQSFVPFAEPGVEAGFYGYLRGPRTGRIYQVVVRTALDKYPHEEPGVYIEPRPENHHWLPDGRLCYRRDGKQWNPATDTFAEALGIAVKYIAEFDGTEN